MPVPDTPSGRGHFDRARQDLIFATERGTSLAVPFLTVLPVTGAAISVLSASIGQGTIAATDATAVRLDELQFDLGEGPCWEALATRAPVIEPNIRQTGESAWPFFSEALLGDSATDAVGAMYAFPLAIGALDIGAIDLWSVTSGDLSERHVADASALATLASWQVLRRVLGEGTEADAPGRPAPSFVSRREIHQATGMLIAQLEISAEDAALLLRAHAFSTDRPVAEIAADVVARRIDFTPGASK
jgi:hypothetical protein